MDASFHGSRAFTRLRRELVVLVGLVAGAYIVATAWNIRNDYILTRASAERLVQGYARVVEEHAARTFAEADRVLFAMAQEIGGSRAADGGGERRVHELFRAELRHSPHIRSFLSVGPDGLVRVNSSQYPAKPFSVADRDYFLHMRDRADAGLFIGSPVKSRFNGRWLIGLSRRVTRRDGSFGGVVVAAVEPEYFNTVYGAVDIGRGGGLYLFRRDGICLVRQPIQEKALGADYGRYILFREKLPVVPSGFYTATSEVDGREKIFAYRTLSEFPIVAMVNMVRDDIFAAWRTRAWGQTAGGLALLLLVAGMSYLMLRQVGYLESTSLALAARQVELGEARARAIALQLRLEDGIQGLESGFALWDGDDRLVLCNRKFLDLFDGLQALPGPVGRTFEEIAPEEIPRRAAVRDPSDAGKEVARRVAEHRSPAGEFVEHALDDGRCLMVSEHRTRDGGTVGIYLDITDRKRAEDALRRSEERFLQSQKMEAVGQLAGGVAHDFNNLLMVITGYVELLLRRVAPGAPMRREMEEIRNASAKATELTRQLLAFSRRQVLQPKVIDLDAVVAGMESMLRRMIGEDVELVTRLDGALGNVMADPSQVGQVLMNLAVNARDAMPGGGRLVIATSSVELEDGAFSGRHASLVPGRHVLLEVKDTGKGMDRETLSRLFEPFFTTKEAGKGTGLGLATVYGIVNQSSGHIEVDSAPGRGTTFRIYFPCVEASAEVSAEPAAPQPARGRETVLVVEDEESVRHLVAEILEKQGYRVFLASCGDEAIALAERLGARVDLLVTDVIMPGMSGREVAGRTAGCSPGRKVLYMSGYTGELITRYGVHGDGAAFLQKPFMPDDLVRKVREVLDGERTTVS